MLVQNTKIMSSSISIMDIVEVEDHQSASTEPHDEKNTKTLEKEIKVEILNIYERNETARLQEFNQRKTKPHHKEPEQEFGKEEEEEEGQKIKNQKNGNTYNVRGENIGNVGGEGNSAYLGRYGSYGSHERQRQEAPRDKTQQEEAPSPAIEVENTNNYNVYGDVKTIGNLGGKENTAIMRENSSNKWEDSENQALKERGNENNINFHGATSTIHIDKIVNFRGSEKISLSTQNESMVWNNLQEGVQKKEKTQPNEKYDIDFSCNLSNKCDKVDVKV